MCQVPTWLLGAEVQSEARRLNMQISMFQNLIWFKTTTPYTPLTLSQISTIWLHMTMLYYVYIIFHYNFIFIMYYNRYIFAKLFLVSAFSCCDAGANAHRKRRQGLGSTGPLQGCHEMRCANCHVVFQLKPFDVVFHGRLPKEQVKPVPKPPEVPKSAWEPRTVFRPTASIKRLRTVRKWSKSTLLKICPFSSFYFQICFIF